MASEFALIGRLTARLSPGASASAWPVTVGIGDDAAVLAVPAGGAALVACTDQVVEGTHFLRTLTSLGDAGWKAIARNVSDLAAMGAVPRAALCSMVVPAGGGDDVDAVVEGLAEAAAAWGCPVVGGDLAGGVQLVVSVTLLGEVPAGAAPLQRSGASAGDVLFLSGPVGRGGAGYHRLRDGRPSDDGTCEAWYARPHPSIEAGLAARAARATACVDVSDGLVQDLGHLATASSVGFVLDADAVPVAGGATLEEALATGDDYVLAFAVPAAAADGVPGVFAAAGLPAPVPIGTCTADATERSVAGLPADVDLSGWAHDL